ncbi:uncharacterized protein LOC126635205 [Myiozetetes cayanensis]|uniref:uncharacterized protein LOC126635205 n=1 Tax=Myiozetetes cayanensis TaxID=478635 RepID=UPI002160E4BD|nr:uncharacterized protein LOC126635205 [Myiozetetes cayanensis]
MRRADPSGSSQINERLPEESVDGELKKSRNGKKQRKRKRSPKSRSGGDSRPEFLLGMAAERVWFDKPLYDRAENIYREKLLDSWSGEAPGSPKSLKNSRRERRTGLRHRPAPPAIPSSAIPAFPGSERAPVSGKPQIPSWGALVAAEAWLEKPLYDSAERNFYERIFSRNSQRENDQENPKKSGKREEIPGIPEDIPACFFLHRDSESIWLHKLSYDRAESRFFSMEASRAAGIRESPLGNPSPPIPAPGMKKMALDHFLHDKVWLEKHKYDDAERRFYERLNGPLGGSSRPQVIPDLGNSHWDLGGNWPRGFFHSGLGFSRVFPVILGFFQGFSLIVSGIFPS